MSDSLWPHGLQHTRLLCPSPTPRAYSNSFLSRRWCHPIISSSVFPFSSLPPLFPSIRVFSSELVLCIRWSKYWSFSFSISLSNEYSGLISFRMDWLDLLAVVYVDMHVFSWHLLSVSVYSCLPVSEKLRCENVTLKYLSDFNLKDLLCSTHNTHMYFTLIVNIFSKFALSSFLFFSQNIFQLSVLRHGSYRNLQCDAWLCAWWRQQIFFYHSGSALYFKRILYHILSIISVCFELEWVLPR